MVAIGAEGNFVGHVRATAQLKQLFGGVCFPKNSWRVEASSRNPFSVISETNENATLRGKETAVRRLQCRQIVPCSHVPELDCVAFCECEQATVAAELEKTPILRGRSQVALIRLVGHVPELHLFVDNTGDEQVSVRSKHEFSAFDLLVG